MGVQDLIALLLVAAAAGYVGRWVKRTMTGRGGCDCGGDKSSCRADGAALRQVKRQPFVPVDQVGRPSPPPPANEPKGR